MDLQANYTKNLALVRFDAHFCPTWHLIFALFWHIFGSLFGSRSGTDLGHACGDGGQGAYFILTTMNILLKVMDCTPKTMNFMLKMMIFWRSR